MLRFRRLQSRPKADAVPRGWGGAPRRLLTITSIASIASITSIASIASVTGCVPDTSSPSAKNPPAAPDARATISPSPDASLALGSADARAPVTSAIPDGPPKWKSIPKEQNGFYAVLDGLCSQLEATRVGKDVVVHYGGGGNGIVNNGMRQGSASFIALRAHGLESIGDPTIASPTGVAGLSADDFWIADSTGSRSSEGAVLYRRSAGVWKRYEKDQTNLHAWVDGGIIGSLGFAAANGDVWVEGSSTKPPPGLWSDLPFPALSAFPTGDILLVGARDRLESPDNPLIARHWAPGKKVTEHPLHKLLPNSEYPSLTEIAPDEVYVVRGDRIARWDGSAFHALARTDKAQKIARVRRAGPDDLWVLTASETLQRLTATSATTIATPEPIVDFDGVEHANATWAVGKSGKLYRRQGEEWKTAPLPAPIFGSAAALKAKRIVVVSPEEVLLTGMYWEKGAGWKDQELHTALYSTRAVKETLRCNEPDPENNNIHLGRGFQSWPPMATAECKTPLAVLARRSRQVKTNDDWPRLRAALKGHPELGELALVDFVSGDRTFVGVKAKDLEAAKAIVALVTKNDRLRPEIVCGDPEPTRTLGIDPVTGAATSK